MAQTVTKAKTETRTKTRVRVLQDSAEHFMDETEATGASWNLIRQGVEAAIAMQLIEWFEVVVHDQDNEAVAGTRMTINWDTHEAQLESVGEDYDSSLLDEYDRPGSVTETIAAMREYIEAVKAECPGASLSSWYHVRKSRVDELGMRRVDQLLGRKVTKAMREQWRREWTAIDEDKNKKGTHKEMSASDVFEIKNSAW